MTAYSGTHWGNSDDEFATRNEISDGLGDEEESLLRGISAQIRHRQMGIAFTMYIPWLAVCLSGCSPSLEPSSKMSEATNPTSATVANQALLDEANAAGNWIHAKKTRPIWARQLDAAQTVQTLEGEEQVAAGHYLCRGEAGDLWPQTEETLLKRYTATDEVSIEGWRKYLPHPDAQGVMATPIDHPFEVHATWGTLSGKAGDYLLKSYQDRETLYPADVWVVDQGLFGETYQAVSTK